MTIIRQFLFLILVSGLLIAGCGKDNEPGPKGDIGATGEMGPQGETGQQGAKGTANVIYKEWFTPVWDIKNEPTYKTLRITEFLLTIEFLEGNVLLVYRKYEHNGVRRIDLLPQLIINMDGTISTKFEAYIYGNGIYITVDSYGADLSPMYYDDRNSFKYILIPGTVITNAGERTTAPVDFSDYEAVVAYYNIPN